METAAPPSASARPPRRGLPPYWTKLALAALLVLLGDSLLWGSQGGGMRLGAYGAALLAALFLGRPAMRRDGRALLAYALAGLAALAMAWDASLLAWCLFWIAAAMATLLPATARFDDGWRWFQRLFVHTFAASMGPFRDHFRVLRVGRMRSRRGPSASALLRLMALPLLGSTLVLMLFSAANPVIERFFSSLSVPGPNVETIQRILFWAILLTLAWSLLRPRVAKRLFGTFDGSGDLPLPGVSPASVLLSLAAFNLLFAVQNAMDAAWLWGLVPLPEGMTLAQYAHRGAYPLVATALLAALFVLVALRPGSATAQVPAIRRLVVLWVGQNLFLVASSMLRTWDYVEAYSLTRLRIAALLWMGLVALGLVLVLWRLLREKSAGWLINANLAAATMLLGAISFVDLGNLAARWNVAHAREIDGTGARLDLCYLSNLGSSALVPLIELEQGNAPAPLLERAGRVRQMVQNRVEGNLANGAGSIIDVIRLDTAHALLGSTDKTDPIHEYDCDGSPYPPYPEPMDAAPPASPDTAMPAPPAPMTVPAPRLTPLPGA